MNDKSPLSMDSRLRVEAALDGELDAGHALDFERELAADPELRALYQRHAAARAAVRQFAPRERAPERLRARVLAMAAEPPAALASRARRLPPASLALAASLAIVAIVGSLAWMGRFANPSDDDPALQALVAGYMRGQVSGQPFDVASSDRHTVKPWLASRVTLGAAVLDLSQAGYPLAGGRIDIVDRAPVPTLIYRRREHFVALSELPVGRGTGSWRGAVDGYHIERWADAERAYVAVSDLDADDLAAFADAFRKARQSTGPNDPAKP
jgi:anti-sigma factor RsiW